MIPQAKLIEWRRLAVNTTMVSALGEYTPNEFLELLDAYEAFKMLAGITIAKWRHWATANEGSNMGSEDAADAFRQCADELEGLTDDPR